MYLFFLLLFTQTLLIFPIDFNFLVCLFVFLLQEVKQSMKNKIEELEKVRLFRKDDLLNKYISTHACLSCFSDVACSILTGQTNCVSLHIINPICFFL